jgi:hypothetical protein
MCVTARVREVSAALRFCNRYVESGGGGGIEPSAFAVFAAGDAADAMGLLDNATFARLHVRSVRADFKVGRGLQLAQLESARTVRVARPGQRVRVVLQTRFPRGPRRDFSFLLRIPRDVHPGRLVVRLSGGAGDAGGGDLIDQLAQALVGGGGGGDNGPDSAARLRRRFAAIGRYDGVTATFPGQGRPHRRGRLRVHAFRDPVVLIQGTAKLTVRIPGPPKRPARK